jgi:hypothetical protein
MPVTCSNCGAELPDEDEDWCPFCPGCDAEPAWTNHDLVSGVLGVLLVAVLGAWGLVEGAGERNWLRVCGSAAILTLCVMYIVSQLRRPRYKPIDTGSPEAAARRRGSEELQ